VGHRRGQPAATAPPARVAELQGAQRRHRPPARASRPGRSVTRRRSASQRRQSVRALSARRTLAADRGSPAVDRAALIPVTERGRYRPHRFSGKDVRHQPYRSALSPQPRIHARRKTMNRGLRPQPALSVLFGGPWLPSQTTKTPSGAILTIRDPVPPNRERERAVRTTPPAPGALNPYPNRRSGSYESRPFP
jgi:hypothetical protein